MSDLLIIGYPNPEAADAARAELLRLARNALLEVADAVVATADADGHLRFTQMADLWAVGASDDGLWGLLAGMLFLNPQLAGLVGDSAAAVSGALGDYGIDDDFIRQVAGLLSPGRATVFLLIRRAASEKIMNRLHAISHVVLCATLDHSAEHSLRQVFARAPAHFATAGTALSG